MNRRRNRLLPRETFNNLKPEKQQRILQAALHEIAANGYDKASVTRIVKEAGIATGSFYQYFDDMDDLFIYIGMEAARMKTTYMRHAIDEIGPTDLESTIRAMYIGGLRFGLENEEYFRCAQHILQMQDSTLYRKMLAGAEESEMAAWLFQMLNRAIENGELHDGITPELLFRLLTTINATIIEYLITARPNREMSKEDLDTLYDLGVHVVLHGIGKHNRTT